MSRASTPRRRRRRVPVVMQLQPTECGPACLAMVLGYHGRPTGTAEVNAYCGSGRDGATALELAQAARRFGLRVRSYSAELEAVAQLDMPVIVHWQFSHYLVVERIGPEGIDVVDPGAGRRRLTPEEFGRGFTGVVLSFEPGSEFEPRAGRARLDWRTFLRQLLRTPRIAGPLLQVLGASLVLQALGLVLPLFTKVLVDDVLPHRIDGVLLILGLGLALLVLAQALTSYLRSALLLYVQGRLDAHVMLGFFEHLLALPYRYFQQRTSGDLLVRLGSNQILRELLTSQTIAAIFDGFLVLSYLLLLLVLQPTFGVVVLVVGAVQVALLLGTSPKVYALTQTDLKAQSDSQAYLVQALQGIETVKASGLEDRILESWSSLFFAQLNITLRRSHFMVVVETFLSGLQMLSPLVLLLIGAAFVLDGSLSLGTMLALNALAASFLGPLTSLVSNGRSLQVVGAHLDRIADVLEAEPEESPRGEPAPSVASLRGAFELRAVTFAYQAGGPPVLDGVDLTIEAGQKVAIVGRTGSGKSTLLKLLLGLYPASSGEIRFDGKPLGQYPLRELRRCFGIVLQESFLFDGSIRRNIALAEPSMPLEQVAAAAHFAAIDEEIARLPMGYETVLGEGGGGLSGGQRQRLSIARAVARRPRVLLLDEATSHLDTQTEAAIDRNLEQLACTRVVIAHRLSTVRGADQIVVLEAGRVAERGTHAELIAAGGLYASMVAAQAG